MNFYYLKDLDPVLQPLYELCRAAEDNQQSHPDTSAVYARRALEWIVKAVYLLKDIKVSDRASLLALVDGEPFREFIGDERLMKAVHYVRKAGNKGAHSGGVKKGEAFFALLNIYNVVGGVLKKLRVVTDFPEFDRTLIPQAVQMHAVPSAEVQPTAEAVASIAPDTIADEPVVEKANGISEAETRRLFIDMMLQEARWQVLTDEGFIVPSKACIEVEVTGMPNGANKGYADYVLFGADGKPLAVVEAKRTSIDPIKGRHQAELYADCLERKYGVRPVIYCSNGYKTEIIDGLGYPVRTVYGFHTEEELRLLIQRRGRKDITDLQIKENITNRDYQKRAIRSVCERLNNKHRRSLLVMATGTGKTRVSISLTEVLMRNQWVKNVLFLADRTALVNQAAKNFAKLLPEQSICVLSEERDPDLSARIMFSTHQTMVKKIDSEEKLFSIGRFDLIIVDEAHRSIFGKYASILSYFDAYIVGLTATPRTEIDRNTFDLFGTEMEDTFAYELGEAVADGYLVPYTPLNRTTAVMRDGIKYNDLTKEQQEQLDPVWEYEKALQNLDPGSDYKRDIQSNEIFKYISNLDTIDKVLQDLMDNGLKVESGDKIGKTIIFAYNHLHAQKIVERFGVLYPHLGSDFCVLIDNYVNYAQDLINKFEVRGKMPQIAVSVDMMDTGIDVPDILNLVFFKPVRSKIKFDQMVGRGTRLSPGVFGAGKDKELFVIFDWCGNFDFFSVNESGAAPIQTLSLTERLFQIKTDIAVELQRAQYQQDPFAKGLHDRLKEELHRQVTELRDNIIAVRENWALVDKYRKAESWTCLTPIEAEEIKDVLSPLLPKSGDDESAKKFDLLMLTIELSLLVPETNADRQKVKVMAIASLLLEKASIPQVQAKLYLIKEVSQPPFWHEPTLDRLERVRVELRDLIKFLTGQAKKSFTIDIEDVVVDKGATDPIIHAPYRQRVIDYLKEHSDSPVIKKIKNIEQLTREDIAELERVMWEELGTKQDYIRYVSEHDMICGDSVAAFIRAQVGVDRRVAVRRFSEFLSSHVLNADQEDYLRSIVDYVCQNGDITPNTIVNEPRFSEGWTVFGDSASLVVRFVKTLHGAIIA